MINSLLWKIENEYYTQSFLFGTMHIYDSNVFRIPDILYRLIDSVDIYLPETNNKQDSPDNILNYVTVDDPDYSLKDYFTDKSYAKILDIVKIDIHLLNKYKPFFVSSLILADTDMPTDSIDYELLNYALFTGKTVCELESVEEQINAINNIPYKEQAEIVENILLASDRKNEFNKLMNYYKEQNLQALKTDFKEVNPTEIFIDSIQKNRNIMMSDKIDSLLRKGYSLFVAVGAMHLHDIEDVKGIVSILGDKGYNVTAVEFSFTY
ncbi:MAG: TraB/GumN family protein [Prevotellaceae bacterium]|jgi:uncharacterized protein YbaP (TraB family)|nr:TraB/GumN family protein [Prevotellaceae bacterium]